MGNRKIQTRSTKCQNRPECSTRLVNHTGRLPQRRAGAPGIGVHHHAAEDVEHVQAGQGVVEGKKLLVLRYSPDVEVMAVFEILHDKEDQPERIVAPMSIRKVPKRRRISDAQAMTIVTEDEIRTIVLNVASGTSRIVSPRGRLR